MHFLFVVCHLLFAIWHLSSKTQTPNTKHQILFSSELLTNTSHT
ncbi:hypothetical protein FDUTEX481_00250 [Tolypothrix sp. PCC 7601]|nr:hypothetical protein FDUTEX481_00250 [Tolypothrix sp. PCC 7601]